ncbi:hypothetical protein [Novosphingopyxis sp. YJ-S2-01]|uniref:hypothetical protein n=1 Tax=Novosphingopyxis sp. YJ-S2-01 TaxID=2794021 RepID=UPI0018DB07EE|nr:hypothetical protein [Novosphingopyxis sp. YJ-S2-01]MBH9536934.1 hypothetical protein [Novosphingopyxis sp. YJ-S2-01]
MMLPTETNALAALILAALGIVAPLPDLTGGLFLSIACAFLVMALTPPDRRLAYWLTLGCCLGVSILTAILWTKLVPNWSLQLLMALAGGLSRHFAMGLIEFGHALQEQMRGLPAELKDGLLARLGLGPGKEKDDD